MPDRAISAGTPEDDAVVGGYLEGVLLAGGGVLGVISVPAPK